MNFADPSNLIEEELKCIETDLKITEITQLLNIENYKECLRAIEEAEILMGGENTELTILKSNCWTHLGINQQRVAEEMTKIIEQSPSEFANFQLGLCYYFKGDFELCVGPFKRSFELNPNVMCQSIAYIEKAMKIQQAFITAIDEFKTGNVMMAIETLSLAQLIDMQLKEVIDIKAKAIINSFIIKQEPSDSVTVEEPMKEEADNRLTECETLIQSNKLAEASEILKEDETTAFGWYLKGFLSYKQAFLKRALIELDKSLAMENAPQTAQLLKEKSEYHIELVEKATDLMKQERNSEAIKLLTTALEVDPDNLRLNQAIYFQRAAAKYNSKLVVDAFDDYLKFEALQNKTGMILNGIKF